MELGEVAMNEKSGIENVHRSYIQACIERIKMSY